MGDSPRIEELKRRVQSDPASIAFAALAEEYRRAGRFDEAIQTCTTGLVRHPSYLSAHVTLGRALIEVGKLQEARTELEYVLKLAPENLAAIRGLAEIHHRIGDEALEHHTEAAESLSAPAAPPVEDPQPAPAPIIPIKLRVATPPDVEPATPPDVQPAAPLATSADDRADVPEVSSSAPIPAEPQPVFAAASPVFKTEVNVTSKPTLGIASQAVPPRSVDPALAGLEEFLSVIVRARSQRAAAR